MRRKIITVLCMAALCLSLLPLMAQASGTIYFTAVNDRLLPLSAETMPMVSGGSLYVPYSVFDSNSTGISLGVSCSYSRSGNTLTIYNLRQMLVFDMDADNARNQHTGQTYTARAITRNGRIYVPVGFLCDFFGLSWSNTITGYGNLIRITNDSAVLNDTDFIDAGSVWMASRLREYLAAQSPAGATSPDPDASASPSVSDPGGGARIYLAFRCDTGEAAAAILDTLDTYDCYALFFFPADAVAGQDDLLRRIVGSGHGIGLLADDAGEDTVARLDKGNDTLQKILNTRTCMALASDETLAVDLEQLGWLCWSAGVNGVPSSAVRPATLSANILTAVGRRSGNIRITMDDSQITAQALPTLLRQLRADAYSIHLALETDF